MQSSWLNIAEAKDSTQSRSTQRDMAISAQGDQHAGQAEQQKIIQSHLKKIKELQRDVDRKNEALAEAAALLVLQKKLRALWDEGEDK